ncbi:uncharacterized protein LTR77_001578 [Saxophila tyrrhenica]|uniref:C3H1-type domain-containing protein n=1 Tax=Saxophila tyrrhenica TaxID=1690608 RepID=A0AAV9PKH6_9PEZI|nr:hypothetical protein LTR77_001578 [Saxophila tyrrhenica]
MDEDTAALQARIAALQSKINNHKQQHVPPTAPYQQHYQPHHPHPSPFRGAPRLAPYGRGRGGERGGFTPVKNRKLVLNGANAPAAPVVGPKADNLVATHPHQLVNKDAHNRRLQQLRTAKRQKINQQERTTLNQHTSSEGGRELTIEGLRFQLREDGSKLVRISDTATNSMTTPKMVKVADVAFYRTKGGNLVRANAIKGLARYSAILASRRQKHDSRIVPSRTSNPDTKRQCEHFTKTGKCPFGRSCHYAHDPEKVAMCPAFLKNKCTSGEYCDLSHVMSINRVPACIHFLRGNCTNDACRYPHVNVSPSAPVCAPFARLGHCANNDCDKRHVFECPDLANKGECSDSKCPLPHPVRAHVLRKAAAKQAKVGSEEKSDISSDEEDEEAEAGFEDIDSDEAEDVIMGNGDNYGHELTQQQDYVPFS